MKLTTPQLIKELSTIIDADLARLVVENYVEMQNRFLIGDWKPSELNGGALCEGVSRCLYQLDTGRVSHKKSVGQIRAYLLDLKSPNSHNLNSKDRNHISKAIELVYKFRSARGVAHISKEYNANYMDSMMIVHTCKWIFSEFLRLAWDKDEKIIAETIEQIVQIEHSLIHELEGKPLVLVKKISARNEIPLLLNHASNNALSRSNIHKQVAFHSKSNINTTLSNMLKNKEIRTSVDGEIVLTPIGQKVVIEQIMPELNPYN